MARKIGFDLFANEEGIATHVDELFLIFNSHKIPLETAYTPRDKAVGEKLLTLWTNFAKHGGDPTPKGASYTGDQWGPVRTGQRGRIANSHGKQCSVRRSTPEDRGVGGHVWNLPQSRLG